MKRSLTKLKDGQHPEVSSGLRIRSSDKFIIAIANISSVFHFIIALITSTRNRELVEIRAALSRILEVYGQLEAVVVLEKRNHLLPNLSSLMHASHELLWHVGWSLKVSC